MSFYLRKSISVGAFRFNLSQRGAGVSLGVRGFRVGTGPRGNYIHMGRGGIYYRATLPSVSVPNHREQLNRSRIREPIVPDGTHAPLAEINSSDVSTIVDSSSRELLEEIKLKQEKIRSMPIVVAICGAAIIFAWSNDTPNWITYALLVVAFTISWFAHARDTLAKTVVLFYEFDEHMERAYGILHAAAQSLADSVGAWHIEAQGAVYNRKYHAGASSLMRRKPTKIARATPPGIKTNIETIAIDVGRQTLHFLPDRVLIYQGSTVGSVTYRELRVHNINTRFIEDGPAPRDSEVVGHTWRFVNKNGTPDLRFNNNRQLPICIYDEVTFSSSTGLNEMIQVSHAGAGDAFANSIHLLACVMPVETILSTSG